MPGAPTTNLNLPTMDGADLGETIDDTFNAAMEALDSKAATYVMGARAALPAAGVVGRRFYATDTVAELLDTGAAWVRISLPAGMTAWMLRNAAPAGYVLADGGAIADAGATVDLHAALGDTLPDLRGRVPFGADGTAERIVPEAAGSLGSSGGEQTHALTLAEMVTVTPNAGIAPGVPTSLAFGPPGGGPAGSDRVLIAAGGSHNNMPPHQFGNWFVKM